MKVKTSTGFSFVLDKNRLNDMRFVRRLTAFQKNPEALSFDDVDYIICKILGSEAEYERLITHLESKSDNGVCTAEALTQTMLELITLIKEDDLGKKS